MAVNNNSTSSHLWMRLLGLTGLLTLAVGLVIWLAFGYRQAGMIVAGIGLAGFLALLGELRHLASFSNRKGAVGSNSVAQAILAAGLLLGINVFSFNHYQRYDWTRDQLFTIPADLRKQLNQLRGETDIIVLLRHQTFGQMVDNKQDHYDSAAERVIVDKVKDLAEQFQELGPRFRVEVLDTHDRNYERRLKQIERTRPELAQALEKAPENSVFFHAQGKVQRLAFHDIYQLDRVASAQANNGEGNLVLNYQGLTPFANKILNIGAKRPKIGVAVIHPVLSLTDPDIDFYTMNGAKKVLESQGFETVDIILKKGWEEGNPEPTAYTFDENLFESLEEERAELEESIQSIAKGLKGLVKERDLFQTASLEKLNEEYIYLLTTQGFRLFPRSFYEEQKKKTTKKIETSHIDAKDKVRELHDLETQIALLQVNLEKLEPELESVRKKQQELKVENLEEQRRITDTRAKKSRLLADCDLLILPRQTFINIAEEKVVPNRVHRLDDAQFAALKDFLRSGKPVLFLLGPANEPTRGFDPTSLQPDQVEDALEELGFKLPKQTILFSSETKAFAQRRGGLLIQGATKIDIPPVEFDWKGSLASKGKNAAQMHVNPNPVRTSVNVMSRGFSRGNDLALKLRYNRPVYYVKGGIDATAAAGVVGLLASPGDWAGGLALNLGPSPSLFNDSAVLMITDADSWNEENPFPTREKSPRFEPTKPDDPNFGTLLERRRGPFPIGAIAEVELPERWLKPGEKDVSVRVGVLGNGGVFVGKNLNPLQQELLLDLTNWLLGRDELLARASEQPWQYPRVEMSGLALTIWAWGAGLFLPLFFVYLGLMVTLVRQMR